MRLRAGARAPPARFWESREVQKRRWINGVEGSIVLDTLHSRNVSSHCQRWLRGSSTAGEDTWRVSRRITGLLKWSEQERFSAGGGRSSVTRDSRCSVGKISCADGTARDAQRTLGRTQGGGKTPKTVCLDGVQNSRF